MRRAALLLLLAIVAPMLCADLLAPGGYDQQSREEPAAAPSLRHPLGTDAIGRDRFSRLLYGGRISVLLAPAAALVSIGIALIVSLTAALLGGWWERAAVACTDLVLSLPWLFLLLAVRAMLPLNTSAVGSLAVVFALLGMLGWATSARVLLAAARGQLAADYVLAARAAGCGNWRIAVAHVAPNLAPVMMAQFQTTAPAFLLSEANLSLLGLGIAEPLPSWGNLLRELQNVTALPGQPWVAAPLFLLVAALSCCQLLQSAGGASE